VLTIRRQRLRRKETAAVDLKEVQHPGQNSEERTMAEQLRQAVMAIVGELPERDRDALGYAFAGEQPPTDERTRKRRYRALERLRAAWRRVHG
jgi:DNA-directed RNA polymerase specialized sigma24 family protein